VDRVVSKLKPDPDQLSLESPTISQVQLLAFQALLIPLQDDPRLQLQPSVAEPLAQALLTQQVLLATSPSQLDQLPVPVTQARSQQLLVTLHRRRQVAPLVISQQAPPPVLATQALKALTRVPELQFHLQTCHHPTSRLKASHPSPTLLTQPQERHKRRPENICHHDEDKLLPSR
jgi:hypothetical protein